MPDFLIRNLKPETVAFLKERARLSRRSVQAEVAALIEEAEAEEARSREFWRQAAEIRESLAGRRHADSAELIREDRDTNHGRDL